jgi:hypothetical protein
MIRQKHFRDKVEIGLIKIKILISKLENNNFKDGLTKPKFRGA